MKFEWKRSNGRRWADECDLVAGKIRLASIIKNIGAKGGPETFRLVFSLPQISGSDVLERFDPSKIDEIKKHAEHVCKKWFAAAGFVLEVRKE